MTFVNRLTRTTYGGSVSLSDPGPRAVTYALLLATTVLLATTFGGPPLGYLYPGVFLALAGYSAVMTARLRKTDAWRARAELRAAIAALGPLPDNGLVLLDRDQHEIYQVSLRAPSVFGWRAQVVTVTVYDEAQVASVADRAVRHVTAREFEISPLEHSVRLELKDAVDDNSRTDDKAADRAFDRQWNGSQSLPGIYASEVRRHRAGSKYATPGQIRDLAGRVSIAEPLTIRGPQE